MEDDESICHFETWKTRVQLHGDVSWVGSTPRSPVPVSLHLLDLQLKPSLPNLRAPDCPIFLFGLSPGDARDRSLIGRAALTKPPFVGPFCRPVGAQFTAQSWHIENMPIRQGSSLQ